jgi:hypothetical protein
MGKSLYWLTIKGLESLLAVLQNYHTALFLFSV